jgi:hypothetical protein
MNKLPLFLLFAATSGACVTDQNSGAVSEPGVDTIASDLDKANGGFTTADEASQFGEEALFADAALEASAAIPDTMGADPTVRDMQNRPDVAVRGLVMMWGQLPADPTHTDAKVWDGHITVSRGAIVGFRKIGFEQATDSVLPRETRATIAFHSTTTTHSDGLALRLIDPTPASTDPLTITYTRDGGGEYSITLASLIAGPQVIDVDGDNKLIAAAVRHRADCDAGSMHGRWRKVSPTLGHFLGAVVDKDGAEIGHVRGIYGERNGEKRMFGKFINSDGAFRGVMVGTYTADGQFTARWLTRAGEAGRIHGVYRPGRDGAERHGGFLARWAEAGCSDDR